MASLHTEYTSNDPNLLRWFLPAALLIAFSFSIVMAQGSGREMTGTGGSHIISGKIYFPSGRRAEGAIQVRLESYSAGDVSTMADSNGSFTFTSLSPGNYTVVVNAGDEFEIARESVTVDSDLNLSRSGITLNSGPRRYTVMVTLRPKTQPARTGPAVINASMAEVPESARKLYQQALDLIKTDNTAQAIDRLKAAISVYPKFPLALNELGVQYLKIGQASKAIDPLQSAIKISPDAFTPKLNLGVALLEAQRFAEAETQLREALRILSAPTAHMYLGLTLAHLQNITEAERELKAAIDSGGDQLPIAHYYLGGLYWKLGEYKRAADELETYLRLAPNAPDAERVRGTIKQLRAKA